MLPRKYKTLSLIEKIKLIEEHEQNKKPVIDLMLQFKVGKTQVYGTLKNKDEIMNLWLNGTPGHHQRITKLSTNEDINQIVWKWFVCAKSKRIPISGSLIQAEALEVAQKLGKTQFRASNGWLEGFKSRHNIVLNKVCGEAENVDAQKVEEWKQKIPKIVKGYEPKDIFNGDETGLLFRKLPTNSLFENDNKRVGGKISDEGLTVFLCANMAGEFEKPIVIGKSARPTSFGHLHLDSLPVHWRFNKNAWMTSTLMEEWLGTFNEKMKNQERNVILFLDNATCHPHVLLSNVKLVEWLPPSATSIAQPMDQGVTSNFKYFYRTKVLKSLLFKMENRDGITRSCKSISVLDAVNWISRATKNVLPETIKNCFVKAGIPGFTAETNYKIKKEEVYENEITELCRLSNFTMDSETIVHFDDNLPAFEDVLKAVDLLKNEIEEDAAEENTEIEEAEENHETKIKTFQEALLAIDGLQKFAASENLPKLMEIMEDVKDILFTHSLKSVRQSSITDFFNTVK